MTSSAKAIVVFLVEGTTDRDALQESLQQLFPTVHFHVLRGDITSHYDYTPRRIAEKLAEMVQMELKRYRIPLKQVVHIFHLMDTDGAFVPDSCVRSGTTRKYGQDYIEHPQPQLICKRNAHKRKNIEALLHVERLLRVPYTCHYFSRNLEHVLHNEADEHTEDEKAELADTFAEFYSTRPAEFCAFFHAPEIASPGDYLLSWEFVKQGINSLARCSNFHLALEILAGIKH